MFKKKIKHICNNCRLFDPGTNRCGVVVLLDGKQTHLPVEPRDPCFFEQEYINPETHLPEDFNEIRQVKLWVEDEIGDKSNCGEVKIEYPHGAFGIEDCGDYVDNPFEGEEEKDIESKDQEVTAWEPDKPLPVCWQRKTRRPDPVSED